MASTWRSSAFATKSPRNRSRGLSLLPSSAVIASVESFAIADASALLNRRLAHVAGASVPRVAKWNGAPSATMLSLGDVAGSETGSTRLGTVSSPSRSTVAATTQRFSEVRHTRPRRQDGQPFRNLPGGSNLSDVMIERVYPSTDPRDVAKEQPCGGSGGS